MLGLSAPETGRVRPATGLQEYTGVVVFCRRCRYRPVTGCIRRSPAAFCKSCHAGRLPLCRYHPLAVRDQAQVALVVSQPSVACYTMVCPRAHSRSARLGVKVAHEKCVINVEGLDLLHGVRRVERTCALEVVEVQATFKQFVRSAL